MSNGSIPLPIITPTVVTPSLKALGKRRLLSPTVTSLPSDASPNGSVLVGKVKEREKRVTRSSLGGLGDGDRSSNDGEASTSVVYLHPKTSISLALHLPSDVSYHPFDAFFATKDGVSSNPSPIPSTSTGQEQPRFRKLQEEGDEVYGRSRHAVEADTSDTYYLRLHRYPEILEKRSARAERDKLIHERSKLILEIEEMRGRGWVYHGNQGGKGEEERRKRIRDAEEKLKRYDALLPNQPRKSGALNIGSHVAPPTSNASTSRAGSPATFVRHSTPVSAHGNGGTSIRIKFVQGKKLPAEKRSKYYESEGEEEEEEEEEEGEEGTTPTVKRDRKAERQRAADRRAGKTKSDSSGLQNGGSKLKHVTLGTFNGDPVEWDDDQPHTSPKRPRLLLSTTFFRTKELRDSVALAATSKGRRSSGRVNYAFGERLPEAALMRQQDFRPYGGVSCEADGMLLEDMIKERAKALGVGASEEVDVVIVNGVVVPSSAITALSKSLILSTTSSPGNSTPRSAASTSPLKITLSQGKVPNLEEGQPHIHGTRLRSPPKTEHNDAVMKDSVHVNLHNLEAEGIVQRHEHETRGRTR